MMFVVCLLPLAGGVPWPRRHERVRIQLIGGAFDGLQETVDRCPDGAPWEWWKATSSGTLYRYRRARSTVDGLVIYQLWKVRPHGQWFASR